MSEVKFWMGTEKVDRVELADKLLVGIQKKGSLGHVDVTVLLEMLAAAAVSGIEPTAEPESTLSAPEQTGKVMYMLGGNYLQPDGMTPLIVPADSFNLGYWNGNVWTVPISIGIDADLSGYATKGEIIALPEVVDKTNLAIDLEDEIIDPQPSYAANGNTAWYYTTSVFSGWATPMGSAPSIKVLSFRTRARATAITSIYWELRQTDKAGALLASGTTPVSIAPNTEKDVIIEFASALSTSGDLYFGFKADALVDFYGNAGPGNAFASPPYGKSAYDINGIQTPGFTTESTNQNNFPVTVGTGVIRSVVPTTEFTSAIKDEIGITTTVGISLPDTIYATVGDKLQLFFRGVIAAVDPYQYDILVTCTKGHKYPRYFEYIPVGGDIGTTTFGIRVRSADGKILGERTCNLVTVAAAQSPGSNIKILCVGDSLTNAGVWCQEASRRLIGSGGSPAGLGLSNISFLGRKTAGGIGFEGNGGWTWTSYATAGVAAYRFDVSGIVNVPAIGAVYTNNGGTFTVAEVNITSGTGYIRCTSVGTPSGSGILAKSSGTGDGTIAFSVSTADSGNPFWNGGALDFPNYVDTYMAGSVDAVYFLLTWNGLSANMTDFSSIIASAKTLVDHIHAEYPSCDIKVMGMQLPSLNGGMGANYGATGSGYADQFGMVKTILNMNEAYQAWCNEAGYSAFMEFINVSSQFDSENNMPEEDAPVNSRSVKFEQRGTNGVHPATQGYYQIADVCFRNIVANYC